MTQAKRTGFELKTLVAREAAKPALPPGEHHDAPIVLRAPPRLTLPARIGVAGPGGGLAPRLRLAFATAVSDEHDRGLAFLFLPVAMGSGAALFYMSATDPGLAVLAAGLLLGLLAAVWTRENHIGIARIALFATAAFTGALAAGYESRNGAILLDMDVTTTISGTVEAREFDPGGRVRYLIRLVSTSDPEIRRAPARVRIVAGSPHATAPIGAMISGRARLSSPSGPVMPGGYDFAFRAFVDGIGAQGFFYRAPDYAEPRATRATLTDGLIQDARLGLRDTRERISARIREILPGDPGGIAAALAVSDRRGISQPAVDALRATGLAHILAISGLHMALAAGTLFVVIRTGLAVFPALVEAWPVKKFAAIGALLTATAYLLISGGSVSTQRAWVMLTVMLVAVLADRPALTMRNVALAATVIILVTPSAVVGPSFQMSFAATAALISAYAAMARRAREKPASPLFLAPGSRLRRWLGFGAKAVLGLAITSLVAGLATGLFSAHHFHRVAGNGLLANVLAMPLVTLVVMPAGLAAMLLMPFGLDEWPLRLMGQGLEGVIAAAHYVNGLGGDVTIGQIPLAATVTAGAGLVVLMFLRSRLRLGGLALIGLGAMLALPPIAAPDPDILISETGDLVGLSGPAGLATNAARPSDFVFSQWQTALRGKPHLPPIAVPSRQTAAEQPPKSVTDEELPPPDPAILDRLLTSASRDPSRFHCAGRGVCAAIHGNAMIVAIDQAALIGAACDRADLVIVAIPVHMENCRSGARLITSRSLRRSGALAITLRQPGPPETPQPNELPRLEARPVFRIKAALEGIVRPWTVQRYYDWRTQSYDLPG